MKKVILLCTILCLTMLAACSNQTDNDAASAPATPPVSAAPDATDNGISQTDETPEAVQFHVETYEADDGISEYITVSGMPDGDIQNILNENLRDFALWRWLHRSPNAELGDEYYWATLSYHIVGDRFLSVALLTDIYSDEHPVSGNSDDTPRTISAQTFDLTTGEPAEELVFGGVAYQMANAADKFTQVYPDDDEAAKNRFDDMMRENEYVYSYFLTEACLAVYFANDSGDDFYRFDALYEDIPEMLAKPLADALGN